ncbi:MAG: hypothetical protein ACM3PZ_03210 [Bacillota bacterium]
MQQFLISRYGKDLDLRLAERQKVFSALLFALSRRGMPGGQYIKKLSKPYDAIEVRVKRSSDLIRLPFYTDITNERLVILNGFHKTDGFKEHGAEDRESERKLAEAQAYYEEYGEDNGKCYIYSEIEKYK